MSRTVFSSFRSGLGRCVQTVNEVRRLSRGRLRVLTHWYRAGTDEMLWLAETIGGEYGHVRSVKEARPVRADGRPIPWYTYPALEYLSQFDFAQSDGFEYGGGNSSLFWASRCRSLTTVESDRTWYESLVRVAGPTQHVLFEDDPVRYAEAVARTEQRYGLIIIDGQHRRACAEHVAPRLDAGGIIVFDNSDWWPQTCAYLRERGFLQVDFTGPGPINRYTWTTSVFFGSGLHLRPSTGRQPVPGIGSLRQVADPE